MQLTRRRWLAADWAAAVEQGRPEAMPGLRSGAGPIAMRLMNIRSLVSSGGRLRDACAHVAVWRRVPDEVSDDSTPVPRGMRSNDVARFDSDLIRLEPPPHGR